MKAKFSIWVGLLLGAALFGQPGAASESGRLDAFFKKAEQHGYSGSVLIARGDKILLRQGYGWQDRDKAVKQSVETVFSVGSITKQFTGAAILKLESQGKLSVNDKLAKFFPEAPRDKADITLHQLLTHTGGCPDAIGDDYENIDKQAFMKRFFDLGLAYAPGTEHRYSNVGYSILGIIVENVSGLNYDDFCYKNLWQPAGMEKTGYLRPGHKPEKLAVGYRNGQRWGTALDRPWLADGPGWHLRANGGVLSTVDDMHRWFLALRGDKVLPAAAREKYLKAQVPECPDCPTSYAYGWVVDLTPDNQRLIWHNGGNGVYNAYMGFVPSTGLFAVISSNSNDKIADDYASRAYQILTGTGGPGLDEKTIDRFAGGYQLPSGSPVRVRFTELDRMIFEWDDADALQLLAGDGSEKASDTEPFVTRSLKLVTGTRQGHVTDLAAALGLKEEEAKAQNQAFWEAEEQNAGHFQEVKPVGAIVRPKRGACLVFLAATMERKTRYFTYVWFGEELRDVRSADVMEKEFEPEGQDAFFSPPNEMRAALGSDGNIILTLNNGEEVVLKRQ